MKRDLFLSLVFFSTALSGALFGFGGAGGSGGGTTYTAGDGLTLTSTTFDIAAGEAALLTGGGAEIDGDKLDVDFTPSNYTPSTSPAEADNADNLTAHLSGIDTALASGSSSWGAINDTDGSAMLLSDHQILFSNSASPGGTSDVELDREKAGVLTIHGALNVGTAVYAGVNSNDFSAGTLNAQHVWWDDSALSWYVYDGSNNPKFVHSTNIDTFGMSSDCTIEWTSSTTTAGAGVVGIAKVSSSSPILKVTDGTTGYGGLKSLGGSRRLHVNTTVVGNVGAGQDDLMAFQIPSGVMESDHDQIVIHAWGDFGGNSGNRTIALFVDGTSIESFIASGAGLDNDRWEVRVTITRTSSTLVEVCSVWTYDSGTNVHRGTEAVLDLGSNTLDIKFTGEDSNSNTDEVQQYGLTVDYVAAP